MMSSHFVVAVHFSPFFKSPGFKWFPPSGLGHGKYSCPSVPFVSPIWWSCLRPRQRVWWAVVICLMIYLIIIIVVIMIFTIIISTKFGMIDLPRWFICFKRVETKNYSSKWSNYSPGPCWCFWMIQWFPNPTTYPQDPQVYLVEPPHMLSWFTTNMSDFTWGLWPLGHFDPTWLWLTFASCARCATFPRSETKMWWQSASAMTHLVGGFEHVFVVHSFWDNNFEKYYIVLF